MPQWNQSVKFLIGLICFDQSGSFSFILTGDTSGLCVHEQERGFCLI